MNVAIRKSINIFDLPQVGKILASILWLWDFRWRSRLQLAELDGAALSDLGISRAAAQGEIEKPFWRA